MNKILLKTSLSIALMCCFFLGHAQEYSSAIGARLGVPVAVSYKQFISDANAIEIYGGANFLNLYTNLNVSAAYQIHAPLDDVLEGLKWYYGGGASVYFWRYNRNVSLIDDSGANFGVQGYLGLDYKLEDKPVNITIDWVPTFIFNGIGSLFGAGYGSVGVRYVLK